MTTGAVSPRRADTRRNHERILAAAAESLARSGEVSFNAVAKRAEVGVGTVYRHFPTPEALILAVGVIGPTRLWANPDCGLKTRGYAETVESLKNILEATRAVRAKVYA